jgi:hypothetical protein
MGGVGYWTPNLNNEWSDFLGFNCHWVCWSIHRTKQKRAFSALFKDIKITPKSANIA